MDGLQVAILRVKLRDIEASTEDRRAIAAKYNDLLPVSELTRPFEMPGFGTVYHAYTLPADDRESLQAVLQAKGFETGMDDPVPVHLQPAYAELVICRWLSAVREGGGRGPLPTVSGMSDDKIQPVTRAF